ncbi:hypothetical protein DUI87_15843 [Hirundo rustica rustica]|uniref:Uncharacterized protein n=1 Tax=Hirundo rustica rustica TaxID=333673 RepID=A0A3M0JZK8_HIRRU|nr:hypothetical protein DUI87_15843 [Hirundo rustica rustica]
MRPRRWRVMKEIWETGDFLIIKKKREGRRGEGKEKRREEKREKRREEKRREEKRREERREEKRREEKRKREREREEKREREEINKPAWQIAESVQSDKLHHLCEHQLDRE